MLENYPATRTTEKISSTVNIRTNLIKTHQQPAILHHYLVTFEPELKRDLISHSFKRLYNESKETHFQNVNIAFDGINMLVTDKKLQQDKFEILYQAGRQKTECKMEVCFKNTYNMNEIQNCNKNGADVSTHVQCLEVVSRYYQNQNFAGDGKKSFTDVEVCKISKGVEVWTGLAQSFKVTMLGLMNNVDIAFQVFYQNINLIGFMIELGIKGGPKGGRSQGRDGYQGRGQGRDGYQGRDQGRDGPGRDGRGYGREQPRDNYGRDSRGYGNDSNRNRRPGGDNEDVKRKFDDLSRNERLGGDNEDSKRQCNALRNERPGGSYHERRNDYAESKPDLRSLLRDKRLSDEIMAKLSTTLKRIKVTSTHLKDKEFSFKASGLTSLSANEIKFELEGKETTVADYFSMKYKRLEYPELPCVVRRRKGMEDVFFPIEVLKIAKNQKCGNKLDDVQTSQMIKIALNVPIKRFDMLKQKMKELAISNNEVLKNFNMVFDNDFLKCKGRVLEPPSLEYGKGRGNNLIRPERGSWNLRNVMALEPVKIEKWIVAYVGNIRIEKNDIKRSMEHFIGVCENFGLMLNPKFEIVQIDTPIQYSGALRNFKPQFVLFILPNKEASCYRQVKWRSEADGGKVITQCVVSSNFMKFGDASFCSNIAMKVNVKMKGKNWKLVDSNNLIKDKSTIVFGADVSHPGIGDLDSPSIVAIVSSLDLTLNNFNTTIRVQERRKEIIENLDEIVRNKLVKFFNATKSKPERIIFFRDGVGESQFYSVFENEILSIKEACKKLEKGYSPKITYIIAQKRHNVRFELLDLPREDPGRRGKEPTGNVVPGTVIDEVGHPVFFDFYMVTHHALLGTARPVRYQVLLNENELSASEIQQMINNMCYQYPRATKAVSVVPVIYYAHLAAARAKCYFIKNEEDKEVYRDVHQDLEDQLFYL